VTEKNNPLSAALFRSVGLLLLFVSAGVGERQLAPLPDNLVLVWPPAGFSLAAALVLGLRYWPGIATGSFLFCWIAGTPFNYLMLGCVAGNTLAAVVVTFLLQRVGRFENALGRMRDVALYLFLAAGVGTTLVAGASASALVLAGKGTWPEILPLILEWWIPNGIAILVITPLFLVWTAPTHWRWNLLQTLEAILCLAGLFTTALISFQTWIVYGIHNYPLAYLPVPFLLWAAFRFGPRGATTGTGLVATLAIYSLLNSTGPFVEDEGTESLRLIGSYIGIMAAINLLLGALAAERRRALMSLAESEHKLRAVVADQTDLICRFDLDGKLTFVNPAFCEFHGKPEAELLGTNFFARLTKEEKAAWHQKFSADSEASATWSFDRRAEAADGHVEWQQLNLRRLSHAGSGKAEFQAVIQNITARKKAELALQEAKAQQEKANFQLQHSATEARNAAEQANRAAAAKADFLANMSHEIRTPLSGILGMLELLGQSRLEPRQKEFTTAAAESANALLHVINDILDFSKIEAGKMTMAEEEFSLRAILDSVLENAATRDPHKKINLAAIVRRDVPHRLTGDPIRLRQVLLNLITNGIKFTEQGEVVVRVQPLFHSHGKINLRFEVADTGIGLTEEQSKKLFQPFMQVDTSSSRKFGGSGLGLAISRRIIQLMGGRIGVHSAVGAGSTFWFEVPFIVPPQPVIERSYPGLVFAQVFIAAPNASLRESLAERLRGWGVDSREVANVADLRRTIEHELHATVLPLILCDEELLAVGGTELRRLIAEKCDPVQCLLLASPATTADGEAEDLNLFANVLLKPVREQPLFDALVAAVAGKRPESLRPVKIAGDTEIEKAPVPTRPRTPVSQLRILAAEDHPFNRKLWQLMLDSFGAHADWATDGRQAVDRFQVGAYDAILMDCNMPELDGHEATAVIRKMEQEQKVERPVRIIALTANALVGEREKCLAAGMDDYISKPFTAQQLYQSLLAAVPPGMVSGESFDPSRLEQLCKDLDRSAVSDMTGDFINELPERLTEVQRMQDAGQWPELKRAAHSLKGLFALYGFDTLALKFLKIEEAAGNNDARLVKEMTVGLQSQIESAVNQLRQWRQTQNAATP
jgi:two-component system, sensor histidine kinase and response regulator